MAAHLHILAAALSLSSGSALVDGLTQNNSTLIVVAIITSVATIVASATAAALSRHQSDRLARIERATMTERKLSARAGDDAPVLQPPELDDDR